VHGSLIEPSDVSQRVLRLTGALAPAAISGRVRPTSVASEGSTCAVRIAIVNDVGFTSRASGRRKQLTGRLSHHCTRSDHATFEIDYPGQLGHCSPPLPVVQQSVPNLGGSA